MNYDLSSLLFSTLKVERDCYSGKTVVVTGAGGGIGFQIARAFSMVGARVVLAELADSGKTAEEHIRAEGGDAVFIRTDVSDPDSIKQLLDETHSKYGLIHTLINNAIFIRESAVADMQLDMWDKTIAVNLRGSFMTCQAVLPEMMEAGDGIIINMVSTDAMPGLSAYIASKQAICAFTQTLAIELQNSSIRVIPFAPGMVDTPGIRSVAEGLAPRLGLKKEEFLNLSLHAAYDGLMPVEHAAAATLLLATRWAETYHGELVNGYEILEKAGLISSALPIADTKGISEHNILGEETTLLKKLNEILIETANEFDRLPAFVRPMAKQGFKNKSGHSLTDWQQMVEKLHQKEIGYPDHWHEQLQRLYTYYQGVPAETARFTKDQAALEEINDLCGERMQIITKLMQINLTNK